MKRSFFEATIVSILLYGCTTWTLTITNMILKNNIYKTTTIIEICIYSIPGNKVSVEEVSETIGKQIYEHKKISNEVNHIIIST